MNRSVPLMVVLALVVHVTLLLAYTFPREWVPNRLRYWSQACCRVLFHQDWRLFAPDPPECGCSVELRHGSEEGWRPLEDHHGGPIWKRMAANACRYAEASLNGRGRLSRLPEPLSASLIGMSDAPPGERVFLRLRRRCADGAHISAEFELVNTR